MSSTDQLARIEPWIDELARKWERYFARDPKIPLPPERERAALERQLKEFSRAEGRTAAERFRLEQVLHRFSTLNGLWQRQLRDREEAREGTAKAARQAATPAPNVSKAASVPAHDEVEQLYESYRSALRKQGRELTVGLDRFRQTLDGQRRQLEAKGAVVEGFDVVESNGQVKLTARIRRGRKE
jgi:hypothetical protein